MDVDKWVKIKYAAEQSFIGATSITVSESEDGFKAKDREYSKVWEVCISFVPMVTIDHSIESETLKKFEDMIGGFGLKMLQWEMLFSKEYLDIYITLVEGGE